MPRSSEPEAIGRRKSRPGCSLQSAGMPRNDVEARELLQIEEADAWFEYLETTTGLTATRYAELEPWAWSRLSQRLRDVRARRARLDRAAEAA